MNSTTATEAQNKPKHLTKIVVNKKPVEVDGPHLSGLAIKQAAISQGVNIQIDFQLAEIRNKGEHQIVGDNDVVAIHEHSEFVATACDDNSDEVLR